VWGSPGRSAVKIVVMDRALRVADRSDGVFEIDVSAPDNIVFSHSGKLRHADRANGIWRAVVTTVWVPERAGKVSTSS